ncbi:16S rRNA (guanine(966)-N(2))-methyltransferase RsmD [Virgibacillus sp. NKC19-16]|uniref:16S rRNA (guanine(966)-N(2))-methyltransferase RsmD n=1 Tax=Virgibacillus salidurans TaxID=2831673 RepID=UPI001F16D124|nr:16S rRNA (guanine(966)-N(2))-methyltransferase RsmD [Virgibacillus sp. NKC19-16]UJL47834.1 16S rRNA (guanine(966)-N(2))-methyltransferase RsmD [Virgibacillus sp. NKC19-16]
MRVISGLYKGRRLKAVPGKSTRPTTDKVKEALFQVIGPYFQGGAVMDLFAGSGSLGIEAMSRGMDQAIFVDKHPKAIHTIHANVEALKLEEQTEVFKVDAFRALRAVAKRGLQFELILFDPPYKTVNYETYLNEIVQLQLLKKGGFIYCEHDVSENLPKSHDYFSVMKQENYGGMIGITIYEKI